MFEKKKQKNNYNSVEKMLGISQGNKKQKMSPEQILGMKSKNKSKIDMLDFGNKSKKLNVSKFFMGEQKKSSDIKKSISSPFGVSSKNKKQLDISKFFGNTEAKAKQYMIKNPEKVGFDRLNQQKGLSMFGDYDKDNVPNILDCNPINKALQGAVHRVPTEEFKPVLTQITPTTPSSRRRVTGVGYKIEGVVEDPQLAIEEQFPKPKYIKPFTDTKIKQPAPKPKGIGVIGQVEQLVQTDIEPSNIIYQQDNNDVEIKYPETQIRTEPLTTAEKAKKVFGEVWEESGLSRKLKERREEKEYIADIRKEARGEALGELEKQKIRNIYAQELQKITPSRKPSWSDRISGAGEGLRQAARDITAGMGVEERPEEFAQKTRALFGYRYDPSAASALVSPTREPYSYKVATALGEEPAYIPPQQPAVPIGVQTYRPVPTQPVVAPQIQPMVAPVVAPVEETVYSPYSKKKVTYTRGPYRKRQTVQATQVVQPVQQPPQY